MLLVVGIGDLGGELEHELLLAHIRLLFLFLSSSLFGNSLLAEEGHIDEEGTLEVGWHIELLGEYGGDDPLIDLLEVEVARAAVQQGLVEVLRAKVRLERLLSSCDHEKPSQVRFNRNRESNLEICVLKARSANFICDTNDSQLSLAEHIHADLTLGLLDFFSVLLGTCIDL